MTVKLKQLLHDRLPAEELRLLVGGFDVVGDIAITIVPPELAHRSRLIGEAILTTNRRIKVVARRVGHYGGEYRTIGLEVIAGENRTETEHRENGVRLLLNPATVYFSVRSGSERMRIASLVQPDEHVLVLFSGVGPFPLVIARNSQAEKVVGIEKNPEAHRYGRQNLARNKMTNVELYQGDVLQLLPRLGQTFDRLVMPLPKGGEVFLAASLQALVPGGWLHFYDLQHRDSFAEAREKVAQGCAAAGRRLQGGQIVKCGHCAPQTFRVCVDGRVQ